MIPFNEYHGKVRLARPDGPFLQRCVLLAKENMWPKNVNFKYQLEIITDKGFKTGLWWAEKEDPYIWDDEETDEWNKHEKTMHGWLAWGPDPCPIYTEDGELIGPPTQIEAAK